MEIQELDNLMNIGMLKMTYRCVVLLPILITILALGEKFRYTYGKEPVKVMKPIVINWCIFVPIIIVIGFNYNNQVKLRDDIDAKLSNLTYSDLVLDDIYNVSISKYCPTVIKVKISTCYRIVTGDVQYLIYLDYDEHKKLGKGSKIKVSNLTDNTSELLTSNLTKLNRKLDATALLPTMQVKGYKTYYAKIE